MVLNVLLCHKQHGFKRIIVPQANVPKKKFADLDVIAVNNIAETLQAINSI